jgi:hypothetical protein
MRLSIHHSSKEKYYDNERSSCIQAVISSMPHATGVQLHLETGNSSTSTTTGICANFLSRHVTSAVRSRASSSSLRPVSRLYSCSVYVIVTSVAQRTDWSDWSVEFEFFTELVMKNSVFWDIARCSALKINRRFGGTCQSRALLATRFNLVSCLTYSSTL